MPADWALIAKRVRVTLWGGFFDPIMAIEP